MILKRATRPRVIVPLKAVALFAALLASVAPAAAATLKIVVETIPDTRGDPYPYGGLPLGLVGQALFEPFVGVGPKASVQPAIAVSWRQEDPLHWAFTLRPKAHFSDGEPIDAAAVAAAVTYLLGTTVPADALPAQVIRDKVVRAVPRDPETIVFETKLVDPVLPLHLIALRVPAPQAWAKGAEAFAAAPVGSGPYKVESWTPAAVTLVPNDQAAIPGKVARLEIRGVADQTARALAVTSGTADIALDLQPDGAPSGEGTRLAPRLGNLIEYLQFVTAGDSPLKDARARRALNYAVDKERLIAAFLGGATSPATQFTHADALGFDPSLAPYPYDPAKAKALLAAAGLAKGFKAPLVFINGTGAQALIFQQIAADLAAIGVAVELRSTTLSTWMDHLFSGKWPGLMFSTGVQGYDPVLALNTRSCTWRNPFYCDEQAMPLVAAARGAQTEADLLAAITALMRYEHDNPPGLMLWRRVAFDALGPHVGTYEAGIERLRFETLTAR